MTEDKERKLYALLAEASYMLANCECIHRAPNAIPDFLERVQKELPTELPLPKYTTQLERPSLSQILSNDPTFIVAVEEQTKEISTICETYSDHNWDLTVFPSYCKKCGVSYLDENSNSRFNK